MLLALLACGGRGDTAVRRSRGEAALFYVECLQILLYKQALNINFCNIKKQALRAAPAPERGGSESIDGSCGGAARAVVAADAAVAGGARRGARQARRVATQALRAPGGGRHSAATGAETGEPALGWRVARRCVVSTGVASAGGSAAGGAVAEAPLPARSALAAHARA